MAMLQWPMELSAQPHSSLSGHSVQKSMVSLALLGLPGTLLSVAATTVCDCYAEIKTGLGGKELETDLTVT